MPRFNNYDLCQLFAKGQADGKDQSHSGNLWVSHDGKRLMNYSTCLVERNAELGKIIFNRTSYSVTTSKIQGYILSAFHRQVGSEYLQENSIHVDDVYMGTSYLDTAAKAKIEWSKGLHDVKVINYFDVWGNKKDGWEINNMCEEHDMRFTLHEDDFYNHTAILVHLKNVGFFKPRTRMTQLVFEDLHEFGVEVYQKKDMMPVCRVEFVHNTKEVNA